MWSVLCVAVALGIICKFYMQCLKMSAQANMLSCKFSVCTDGVKISLYTTVYCTLVVRLQVAYNDALILLL